MAVRWNFKVAGVTFEGRQEHIKLIKLFDPVRLVAEPENKYDPNALAVVVALEHGATTIGYVPKELASVLAPQIAGKEVNGIVLDITGGFEKMDGSIASLGVIVALDLPAQVAFSHADDEPF